MHPRELTLKADKDGLDHFRARLVVAGGCENVNGMCTIFSVTDGCWDERTTVAM